MDQIRSWLFIGGYRDTIHLAYLQWKSISAIFQLAEKVEQPNIFSLYLAVEDLATVSTCTPKITPKNAPTPV